MKKLLIIPLLFVCFVSFGQTVNPATIIGKSVRIDHLEVAQFDFPVRMNNLYDAVKVCEALGKGWRLPSKVELNILYQNKNKIGGFTGDYYMSSTGAISYDVVWVQRFGDGFQDYFVESSYFFKVRAVRAF